MTMGIRAEDIKVVFFDLGKVILKFSHQDIVDRLLSHADPDGRRPDELFTFLFDMKEGLCNLYDEGNISSRDFYAEIDRRFTLGVDYEGFIPLWEDIFTECVEVSALIRQVQKRLPVYLLSNVNELHWEHVKHRYPVLSEMDGWVLSYEVKAKKPSPAIYAAALRLAGAGPGQSIFIDDLEENSVAASECGIHGITFRDADALKRDLLALNLIRP